MTCSYQLILNQEVNFGHVTIGNGLECKIVVRQFG